MILALGLMILRVMMITPMVLGARKSCGARGGATGLASTQSGSGPLSTSLTQKLNSFYIFIFFAIIYIF